MYFSIKESYLFLNIENLYMKLNENLKERKMGYICLFFYIVISIKVSKMNRLTFFFTDH